MDLHLTLYLSILVGCSITLIKCQQSDQEYKSRQQPYINDVRKVFRIPENKYDLPKRYVPDFENPELTKPLKDQISWQQPARNDNTQQFPSGCYGLSALNCKGQKKTQSNVYRGVPVYNSANYYIGSRYNSEQDVNVNNDESEYETTTFYNDDLDDRVAPGIVAALLGK